NQGAARLPAPPAILVLPKTPNVAPGYSAPRLETPSAGLVGVTQQPFIGITLQSAVAMALMRDPNLALAQANRRIAQYRIAASQGTYDVRLSVEPLYTYSKSAPQNAFFAGPNFGPIDQQSISLSAGLAGTLRGGQQFNLTSSAQRVDNNATINAFNPYYPSIISGSFTQPFGRNRGVNDATRSLQLAQINADSADAQTLVSVENTVAQVQNAYWDLVAAWRNVAIQEDALKEALLQQRSNERLARHGVNAPVEVVQSNTQVNVFQDNVFSALENVGALQNELKALIVSDPGDPVWSANLVPTTPVLQLPREPSLADLATQALQSRPEIAQLRDARRSAIVNVAYAENQIKPQVDLRLGYTSNGFAGQPTDPNASPFTQSGAQQVTAIDALIANANRGLPPSQQIPYLMPSNSAVPGYLVGNLGQSLRNLASNKFPAYSAGFQVSVPLGNRTAKAELGIARTQERIVRLQESALITRITVEVRDALQSFKSAQYRLIAARSARQASEAVLASEKRRFRNGVSTTYLVLQRQLEVAENRGRELRAQTSLNKAIVEIERATGQTANTTHIDLNRVGEGALSQ
ncbi:MAG: TolC family protein, partial [Candidatus Eremiobacteraeota bacterium]|nr:TolC family protein [Candidatus Eremiobacteraeota bacterium]